MLKRCAHHLLLLLTVCNLFGQINSSSPTRPFNSNTSYPYGIMPKNLPTSGTYTKSQDAATSYEAWKSGFVEACGDRGSRVRFDDSKYTVSEGIAYGMLMAAYAGDKPLLDNLWKYYSAFKNGNGVMHWKTEGCNTVNQQNGATDAELDAAWALIIASVQWPNTASYKSDATTLINAIKSKEIHPSSKQTVNGDGWGFSNNCRNPSYFAPAYYREFALFVPGDASFWNSVADAADDFLIKNRNASNGLVSNWADQSGSPNDCNNTGLEYGSDACRNPWRMAVDVLWHGPSTAKAGADICPKLAAWTNGKHATMKGPIALSASDPSSGKYHNSYYVPTWSVAVMGTSSTYQTHMDNCYTESKNISTQYDAYYGPTLKTLMLFVMSGNFWKPGTVVVDPAPTVNITAPANNASYDQGVNVTFTATATAGTGTVSKVEFFDGTTLIGTATSAPYSISTSILSAGAHTITAKVTNSGNATATSTAITVTIKTVASPVVVTLTGPTSSDFGTGSGIELTATASTTGGNITKVEFYVDGNFVGSDDSAPYSYTVTGLSAGSHTLVAKATDSNGKTATSTSKTISLSLGVSKVSTPPVIDGDIDAVWENPNVVATTFSKTINGTVSNTSDLSGTFKTLWDNTYLYVLGNITDEAKVNDSPEAYNDDAVEVYIDINNDKATTYGANDVQYTFGWDDNNTVNVNPSGRSSTNISSVTKAKTGGYIFEARIPWSTLQGNPAVGQKIGFDFMVNDDDDNSTRDGKLSWAAATDDAWQNPSIFGTLTLSDLISGIHDPEIANVSMYPNPFNNNFRIDNLEHVEFVEVLDAHGKIIETLTAGTTTLELGNNYAKGLYFVKLKYANKSTAFKMIKQ